MFKVYWTNHCYASQETFATIESAIDYGRSKCFEFSVWQGVNLLASWGPISGLRYHGGYKGVQ